MKVRVLIQPTGLINGQEWPEPGGELELADAAAEGMIAAGWLERVKPSGKKETRPAGKAGEETR